MRSSVVVAVVAAVALAGCSAGKDTNGGARPSVSATGASPGSTHPPAPTTASPGAGAPVPPSARGACVASVEEATVRPADPPAATCLVVGATLKVDSAPAPQRAWQPLNVSDPKVLNCASKVASDGSVTATCRALRPGTAVVSTMTEQRPGGPQGPLDYLWQLTVRVVA